MAHCVVIDERTDDERIQQMNLEVSDLLRTYDWTSVLSDLAATVDEDDEYAAPEGAERIEYYV